MSLHEGENSEKPISLLPRYYPLSKKSFLTNKIVSPMHTALTFGGISLLFCVLTWAAALFGELYPHFGNREEAYCVTFAVLCHLFAAVAYYFKSGRKLAVWSLISFWLVFAAVFVRVYLDLGRSMRNLD